MPGEQKKELKIILAEDHEGVRRLIRIALREESRFDVVAEIGNGLEAVEVAKRLKPDVLIVDIRLPGLDGIEVTQRVKSAAPSTKIIVMSVHDDDAHIYSALAAGASGYVIKSGLEKLQEAIDVVHSGEIYLTPPVSLKRIEEYQQSMGKPRFDRPKKAG